MMNFEKLRRDLEMEGLAASLDAQLNCFGRYLDAEYGDGTASKRLGSHPTLAKMIEVVEDELAKELASIGRAKSLAKKIERVRISSFSTSELAEELLRRAKNETVTESTYLGSEPIITRKW